MKSLVTGSHGWIGSNLVKHLENLGDEVITFDLKDGQDILDPCDLIDTFHDEEPDRVFHLAAQAFMGPGEKNPYLDVDVNVKGMINMLRCLEAYNVPMLYTSSGAVYGVTPTIPQVETAHCMPMSNYGCSKLAAEYYLKKWVTTKDVDARIVRFSSVYGAGRLHGPINIFIKQGMEGKPVTVFGDGSQTRDYTYIDDACRGAVIALSLGSPGEVYNIGSGVETSVNDIANIIGGYYCVGVEYVAQEYSAFDLRRSYYDIAKANRLGYYPKRSVAEGIMMTIDGLRE